MGPWDRETVDGETVKRCGGGMGLEVAGGEGCAAVLVLGCMVVGLFTWYSRTFWGGIPDRLGPGGVFWQLFQEGFNH